MSRAPSASSISGPSPISRRECGGQSGGIPRPACTAPAWDRRVLLKRASTGSSACSGDSWPADSGGSCSRLTCLEVSPRPLQRETVRRRRDIIISHSTNTAGASLGIAVAILCVGFIAPSISGCGWCRRRPPTTSSRNRVEACRAPARQPSLIVRRAVKVSMRHTRSRPAAPASGSPSTAPRCLDGWSPPGEVLTRAGSGC